MTPLTVAEARAILRADEALEITRAVRLAAGAPAFDAEERAAWERLVTSARDRIVGWPKSSVEIAPYPGGNEPGLQTLAVEAAFSSKQKTK